jgi:predicted phosphatase
VTEHPTKTKDRLMNKILSNMMLNCNEKITPEQVIKLQEFKDTPYDFKYETPGYPELLNFSLDHYTPDPSLSEEK